MHHQSGRRVANFCYGLQCFDGGKLVRIPGLAAGLRAGWPHPTVVHSRAGIK